MMWSVFVLRDSSDEETCRLVPHRTIPSRLPAPTTDLLSLCAMLIDRGSRLGEGVAETLSATTTIELAVPNAYVGAILGIQVLDAHARPVCLDSSQRSC